jgi:hypothetical protein
MEPAARSAPRAYLYSEIRFLYATSFNADVQPVAYHQNFLIR